MIQMPIDAGELSRRIETTKPTWFERAARETAKNRTAGRYVSTSTMWSEIKSVFVEHQRHKCAYCERQLGSAGVEWDVEHFRPKRRVDEWRSQSGVATRTGHGDDRGYFLVAFDPRNYLVACKPCNSDHKRNYFPVARRRRCLSNMPDILRMERPYLLNPLDELDTPPESLIGFHGINPRAITQNTRDRARAVITAEVLGLDRADLDFERSKTIMHVWNALQLETVARFQVDATDALTAMTGSGSPFANCARCFRELFESNRDKADQLGSLATAVVRSYSR